MNIKDKKLKEKQHELDLVLNQLQNMLDEFGIGHVLDQDVVIPEHDYADTLALIESIKSEIAEKSKVVKMTKELDIILFLKDISSKMKSLANRLDHVRYNKEIPFQAQCFRLRAKFENSKTG